MGSGTMLSLAELASLLKGELRTVADEAILVRSVAPLESAGSDEVVYAGSPANCRIADAGLCAAVLVSKAHADLLAKPVILVEDPKAAWIECLEIFSPKLTIPPGISAFASVETTTGIHPDVVVMPKAVIMTGVTIGSGTVIWPGAFIGEDVIIGNDCVIHPNAVIREACVLGNRVIIHAGAVIGADGFGYKVDGNGKHRKIPQIGNVIIEDDVEIGANATIDRSTCGSTRIGAGTKIDNLVQIAHNVVIGKNNIFAAQAGIAGSTTTGENCIFAGQAGVADHCRIGDRVVIGPQAGVQLRRVKSDTVYFGTPAIEMEKMQKILPYFHRLPELLSKTNGEQNEER